MGEWGADMWVGKGAMIVHRQSADCSFLALQLPEAMEIRQETGCPSQSTVAGFQSASGNGGIAAFPPMRGGLR